MHNKLEYKPIEATGGKTPGPGAYEYNNRNKNTAPSYKQGSEKRSFAVSKLISDIPASNTYKPNLTYTQNAASKWAFGSEKRKGVGEDRSGSPGPGMYKIEPLAFDNKKARFYVGQKNQGG